jgi:dipeptidyl aminopeptidase/acylaminoacyl peptidase
MPLRRTLLLSALLLPFLLVAPAAGQAPQQPADGRTPIRATDLFKIRQLEDVAVAPGGRSVVYTVKRVIQRPDSAGGPTYRTHLYRVDARGRSAPQQLTFGEKSAHSPAWHPSGDRLAFVRSGDSGTPQVFILPMTGGEAYQLTHAEHGAGAPAFSRSGEHLLYASRLPHEALRTATGERPGWAAERPGRPRDVGERATPDPDGSLAEVRAYLAEERAARPGVINRLDFQDERSLAPERTYRHLFVARVPEAAPAPGEQPEAVRITSGFRSFGGGSWMPESNEVVVSGAPTGAGAPPDRVRDRDLFVAATDGPGQRPFLSMDGYALLSPRVAPGGEHVAFGARRLADAGYAQGEIGLHRFAGGPTKTRLLTRSFDRSADAPQWSPGGWHLYATAPSEGAFPLYRLSPFARAERPDSLRAPTDSARAAPDSALARTDSLAAPDTSSAPPTPPRTPAIERLTGPRRGVRAFDVGRGGSLFYVVTRPQNPFELYTSSGGDRGGGRGARPDTGSGSGLARTRRLTAHNADWLAGRVLSTPQPFTVQSDSLEIDGWTMRPTTDRHGTPAPLLVQVHGGPMAMWGPGEATMWHEFQYFAARGYALVYSNPRGSGGYGQAFKRANYRDWARGPTRDVLAAADYAAALDWTDPERQILTGGSYAGYLTAWIVSQTDRFRAAAAQRGVYDLATFLGEGNAWRLVPYHFGGFPWESADEEETPNGNAPVIAEGGLEGSGPAEAASGTGLAAPDTTAPDTLASDTTAAPPPDSTASSNPPRFASPREALIRNSPITYVDQIRTPLLIMHADEDLRTGVSQSEMLYKSLKILERPVEYARYPEAGHDLSRTGAPAQRLDRILRIWEFFERYL